MLADLDMGDGQNLGNRDGRIALDCSVRKTKHKGLFMISTTDFFFPLVESPYLQGRIGACNVLSDLYAEGVVDCDFVLMLLAASTDMPDDMRKICTRAMVRGFNDACAEAETTVTGGQTVLNPWPIIGGVATSLCTEDEFVSPDGALVGDVVVVTKPMGTQVAVNLWQWCKKDNAHWKQCVAAGSTDEEKARLGMHKAVESMGRLNRNAAKLMIKYGAHAATDVTGFGIMGHAQNLSENQQAEVGIEIHTLPCIAGMCAVGDACGIDFKLREGYSAETSGGLMICLPAEAAAAFCEEYQQIDGMPAWEIGRVVASAERKSCIVEGCQIVEV
eukprot:TRINITY_DN14606_c0_g1_i4.p1 TRINITY_DN14606_c0_g1~~TRINITY_DN14606_c0_g1_i4.p1  ORF type:complete len:331 (-),score=88.88 TRINITY_DN14606_c0_g1_i4:338-1330(-)